MKPTLAISICTLSLAACGTSDTTSEHGGTADGTLEIGARSFTPVSRTELTCTEHPVQVPTPCYNASPIHGTWTTSPEPGVIELSLARSSNATDGGSVSADITLRFFARDTIRASARQTSVFDLGSDEIPALGGWIRPVALSSTLDGRNAGWFSIDFEWGTVSGAYDSTDPVRHGN